VQNVTGEGPARAAERILFNDGLQPQVCDSAAERAAPAGQQPLRRPGGPKPRYGKQVVAVLTAVWEAAGGADLPAKNWIVPVALRDRALM